MIQRQIVLAAGLVMSSLVATSVRAELIVYEPFAYTPTQSLIGQNGGQGFSAAWFFQGGGPITISGTSIPIVGLEESGNKVYANPSNTSGSPVSTSFRYLTNTFGSSGTVYLSYAIQYLEGDRFAGLSLIQDTTQVAFFGKNSAQPNWRVSSGPFSTIDSGIAITTSPTLLVLKIEFNQSGINERLSLFVNPTPGAPEPTPAGQVTSTSTFFFNRIEIGSAANNGSQATTRAYFDEIRVSTTWAEAVPVPEPATFAMLVTAVMALTMAPVRAQKSRRTG
jgi:hypothetical protein